MVDVSLLQSLSYVAAAIGVCAAAIYYMMVLRATQTNMRLTLETRKLQFINDVNTGLMTEEGLKRYATLLNMEWRDYDDFERKYGSDYNLDNFAMRNSAWNGYDLFGAMLRHGLVDAETLYNSVTTGPFMLWAKFEDVIREQRRRYVGADYLANFEYLAKEMLRIKLQRDPSYKMPETFIKYVPDN
ncbi:hypothetical protein MUO93_07205 [Candidatus Bathyarchaeota archaeon]|nr:hypothetical protein [Candidatus Bathyarchaeota archaeon]